MRSIRDVLRGNLVIFTLGDVIRQLSMFITFPYFSLYIQALGGDTVDVGVVNSFRPFAALFIYPIAGFLADRYSRVKIIAISGYISAFLYFIFLTAPDWRFLAVGNFLLGLMVFSFPSMNALMADSLPPQRRGIGYSLWRLFPGVVGIVSPYIGGYLITVMGIEYAMRILYGWTVVTAIGIATMNLKLLKDKRRVIEGGVSRKGIFRILSTSYRDVFNVLRRLPRSLKVFMLMLILSFFINNLTAPYWVIYSVRIIGLSELQWGTALLLAQVVNMMLLLPAGMIVDKIGVKKVLSLASALAFIPVFLFPFNRSFTETALLFVVITVANTFLISASPTFMAQSVSTDKRGRVMAALGQGLLFINTRGGTVGPGMGAVLTIPSVMGSILGGFVYDYNPTLLWIILSASMIINTVMCLVHLSPPKEEIPLE